ncbi:MAG: flagellar hook-basal body complex protein FliE [Spirochaetaceae bacterium]|nr:flagellar hook-basal body complex protein FliE [Spirochaetaceae bacterium]
MLTLKPELQRVNPLPLTRTDSRHVQAEGVVGFKGSYDRGGMLSDITPTGRGAEIAELGTKIGAESVLRMGSVGAAGIGRHDNASFANAMLNALDGVSSLQHRATDLEQQAVISPDSINVESVSIAQAEATLSLSITRTILSRLTQAWRDLINTR